MSREPVLAVVRPSHRSIIVLITVLGGLLLGGAAEAKTFGRIVASEMAVDRCEDFFGTCEWRLTCKIGNGADTELLPNAEVAVADEAEIGKTFEVPAFPVNVACTLAEDDGWFGASWEEVATATLAIPGGGDYTVELGNESQGAARVSFVVDSLEMGEAPAPSKTSSKKAAPKEARQYLAVFGEKPEGHGVVMGLPWDAFKARVDQFAAAGPKLVYLQTWDDGGQRLWAGIFRTVKGKQLLVNDLDWDTFIAEWKKQSEQKMVLADLEIYSQNSRDYRFAGVYHESEEQNPVWIGQSRDEFMAKFFELSGKGGMRLVDLEVYKVGDRVLYAGVFRPGHGSYGLWTELDWDAFATKAKGTSSSAVTDIAAYTVAGRRVYDGVIRGGSAHEIEPGLEGPAFVTRWKEQLGEGIRLVSFETWP